MKKYLYILFLFLLIPAIGQCEDASATISKMVAKIRSAKSLEVDYTLSTDGQSMKGHLTLSGDRFILSSGQLNSWYDGKTQWTYSTYTGEVNITSPTAEELAQVNPFSILSSLSKDYKTSSLPSSKGISNILLTNTKKGSEIVSVKFSLNTTTYFPSAIFLKFNDGREVSILITSIKTGGVRNVTDFRFNPASHPGVQVIDLR